MSQLSLWQRLTLVFATLLLACFASAAWLQMAQSMRLGQQIEQSLLRPLAGQVAEELQSDPARPLAATLRVVAQRLQSTNPGIDLYLLDTNGRVEAHHPQTASLKRPAVALGPLRQLLAGQPTPVLGDDPLSTSGRRVFSVAVLPGPLVHPEIAPGYVYAVLQGSAYDMAAALAERSGALQVALWSIGLVTPLGLLAGLVAFRHVARPITRLTHDVQALERVNASQQTPDKVSAMPPRLAQRNEIAILRSAFEQLAQSNARNWQRLNQQDQQRREWIANISHDLRTPLASLQGYLETVLLQSSSLSEAERVHYLRTALAQAQRLSRMAQELLELARLELGTVKPGVEDFSLVELAQDVMQKLALSATSRQQVLVPDFDRGTLQVLADIGMIERVLTNLLDNAIRHTPPGGEIQVRLRLLGDRVQVEVADRGPGIPPALRSDLFTRAMQRLPGPDGGGLGLAIVKQILQLHGSDIALQDGPGGGAVFAFSLPTVP